MAVALLEGPGDNSLPEDLSSIAELSVQLLEDIRASIQAESEKEKSVLPSATKILQPKDKHIVSRLHFTDSSPGFVPRSEQFYNGKQLIDKHV